MTTTFADVAHNLLEGANLISNLLHASCLLLGTGFIIYSFIAYRNHRLNPKMVPLDQPIMYLFMGIVLVAIPFLEQILENTTGETVNKHHSQSVYHEHDIDAPLEE
jgi:hypothetical protein